jgi:hypothetical protein
MLRVMIGLVVKVGEKNEWWKVVIGWEEVVKIFRPFPIVFEKIIK